MAWCLRITDVDPLHYDLLFERFLNPERVSLPDIDVDFCERRRGEVIDYVTRKYGRENVSQIITFGTMKAKAVVRDVGRAMDMPYAEVDRIAKQIPAALDMTLEKALAENPVLKQMHDQDAAGQGAARDGRPPRRHVAQRWCPRRRRRHRAGPDHRLRPALQEQPRRNHDAVGDEGGRARRPPQDGLPRAEHADAHPGRARRDQAHRGVDLDIDAMPLDDPETYQLFVDGQTYGIFQFESSGMREILRKAKPQRLDDLIAMNALYRPGPLKSGMVDDFIARKAGRAEVKYELPQLEPILADTYGVIAYQEQVMRIASVLAGFSLGAVRRAAQGHGEEGPQGHGQAARGLHGRGARRRASTRRRPTKIFDLMEYFAGYGFNKSHSTAYAYLAYQTAYLKANYPRHFAAALLTIEAANTDKLALYISECRDRGIAVLPPDLNESQLHFTVVPEGVRFGLTAIKGLGEGAIQSILEVRQATGRITSLHQLCESLDLRLVNKRVLEALVKSGACDTLIPQGVRADRRARHALRRRRRRDRARQPHAARSRSRPGGALRRRRRGRRPDDHPAAGHGALDRRWSCSASRRRRSACI